MIGDHGECQEIRHDRRDAGAGSASARRRGLHVFVSEALSRHVQALKLQRLAQADEAERGTVDPDAEARVADELATLDRDGEATRVRPR